MAEKYRIWNPRGALIILRKCSTLVAFWGSRFRLKLFRCFSAISGDFWHNTSSKTPDSESSHLANHSAPNISCRGILGLEIEAKIVSSRFLQISVISAGKKPKTPDSDSLRRADHFAPDISSRDILGLEIRAKIVSSRFLFLSASSRHNMCHNMCQKHR